MVCLFIQSLSSNQGKVLVVQLCLTLCDPMDPGSSILQARILEWVAIPFSRGFPDPGIKPRSSTLQADSLLFEPQGNPSGNQRPLKLYCVDRCLLHLLGDCPFLGCPNMTNISLKESDCCLYHKVVLRTQADVYSSSPQEVEETWVLFFFSHLFL